MKKKLLLIIPAVIILIVSITLVLRPKTDNQKIIKQDNKIEETSKKEDKPIIQDNKEETVEKKEEQQIVESQKEEVKKTEQKQSTNNVPANNTPVQPKEEPKTETVPVAPVQQPVQEPPREQTEWEKLGISEYDYYNSPMWSWARVDYSVKTYGSFDATHQACINAGNQLEDIISFSCTNINSYSGDYLGDMLRVKY